VHIPDGYLSPQTCAVGFGATVPVWTVAARRAEKVVTSRHVPLLAIGAAYCFLVMMFNVPIPDGTTAHAVGAVLVACLLGPWAAVIAVSIALAIQALFFGDGGVLAYGVNCCNMAVVMPFVGYGVYRLGARRASLTSPSRAVAAGAGAYIGLNAAALCAAIEFGIQPDLFHRADGTPLYAPFHLSQAIPAMMLAHLLIAGAVDAALTAGVIAYLQRANVPMLRVNHAAVPDDDAAVGDDGEVERAPASHGWRWAWIGLGGMALLTPLGLIAPGSAFGEVAPHDLAVHQYGLTAVPDGLRHYAGFFHHAIFDGYSFRNDRHPALAYLVSAAVGLAAIAIVVCSLWLLWRAWRRRRPGSVA
jgi:cobalt/nickel transport system permease protein